MKVLKASATRAQYPGRVLGVVSLSLDLEGEHVRANVTILSNEGSSPRAAAFTVKVNGAWMPATVWPTAWWHEIESAALAAWSEVEEQEVAR